MVEKYIKELLFQHDCVVIPGFGAFLCHYQSAEVHPLTNKFTPPYKTIGFNQQLQINDGHLVTLISTEENTGRQEALEMVEAYVSKIKSDLRKFHFFEIPELGRFFYNASDNLEFEPAYVLNYHEDSFGLSEIYCKPIEREYNTMNKVPPRVRPAARPAVNRENLPVDENGNPIKPKRTGLKIVLILLPIIMVIAGAGVFVVTKKDTALSGIFNFSELFSKNQTASETPVEEVVSETEVTEDLVSEETGYEASHQNIVNDAPVADVKPSAAITNKQGRYFIVVGSFLKKENAQKLKKKINNNGGNPTVIQPSGSNQYYKVAVADFDTKEEAVGKLEQYRGEYGSAAWVMNY